MASSSNSFGTNSNSIYSGNGFISSGLESRISRRPDLQKELKHPVKARIEIQYMQSLFLYDAWNFSPDQNWEMSTNKWLEQIELSGIKDIRKHLRDFENGIQAAYQRRQKRIGAAMIIQRNFLKCYYHLEYKFCRDRLERE